MTLLRPFGPLEILGRSSLDFDPVYPNAFLSYACDSFLRISSRGERYPSTLGG